jgi:hypothetical protein
VLPGGLSGWAAATGKRMLRAGGRETLRSPLNLPFNRPNRCGDYSAATGLGGRG